MSNVQNLYVFEGLYEISGLRKDGNVEVRNTEKQTFDAPNASCIPAFRTRTQNCNYADKIAKMHSK